MAKKTTNNFAAPTGDPTDAIEELFDRHQTPRWARLGLMMHEGWAAGKRLTEAEFLRALHAWLKTPVRR